MKPSRTITTSLIAVLLLLLTPNLTRAQANTQYFPETQHNVSGLFLDYWNNNGGLAQQGYPLTEPFQEKSDLNGQTYTVQYFERAVFEAHPENQSPYNVLLSQLGTFLYKQKYPTGAPNQTASAEANAQKFPQTGFTVGGKFLTYWQQHGGLAQQGYPISNEFSEKSDLNGQTYTVQYFERAVFEMHPENQAPYDVLLSQLGKFQLEKKYPNNSNPAAAPVGSPGIVPPQPTATYPAAQPSATSATQPSATPAAPTATVPAAPTATNTPSPQGGSGNSTCTPPSTVGYSACATMSDATPSRREDVTTYATLFNNNAPAAGVAVQVIYHYKTTNSDPCNTTTAADGTAHCLINIGGASSGNPVEVSVTFTANGQTVATATATFTPK